MQREVFERKHGSGRPGRGAFSDDYALTHAVRRAGLRVAFVPEVLVGSESAPWASAPVLSWAARQISITRVYWPAALLAGGRRAASPPRLFSLLAPVVGGTLPLALADREPPGARRSRPAACGRSPSAPARATAGVSDVRRLLWAYALMAPLAGLVTAAGDASRPCLAAHRVARHALRDALAQRDAGARPMTARADPRAPRPDTLALFQSSAEPCGTPPRRLRARPWASYGPADWSRSLC